MKKTHILFRTSVAVSALTLSGLAQAQSVSGAGGPGQTEAEMPGDIVITATKQSNPLSRVPISVTAITQKTLDEQGVKNIADLVRTVPALTLQRSGADSAPNLAIRGIYSVAGSPTTGIYLDDVPLQKRNALSFSGNGSPIPELFDLERVEVVRGPQGTLYGGSSEGGAIRFVTPTPTLTTPSVYARMEGSYTENGSPSAEAGVAVGVPLVQDKIGLRLSAWDRETGGYIDHISVYDPSLRFGKNVNWGTSRAFRAAMKAQLSDALSITPAFYYSYDHANDVDTNWQKVDQGTTAAYSRAATGTDPGYTYAAHTYGPYTQFGPYTSGNPYNSPRTSELYLPSLTIDLNAGFMAVKSITAYTHDTTDGDVNEAGFSGEARNIQGGIGFVAELPYFDRQIVFGNKRNAVSEELRLSSPNPSSRFGWVLGGYYSHSKVETSSLIYENLDQLIAVLRGQSTTAQYKAPLGAGNLASSRFQTLTDIEYAAFGEAYFNLTPKLKVTAGARVSRTIFQYAQTYFGTLAGFTTATASNGGLSAGEQKATPVTPKFGVTYQITPNDMIYATAAKGFRPGGVNAAISQTTCAAGLALYGGNPPTTYGSDSVWSYEAGTKFGILGNKLHAQASAFWIDWNQPQLFETFPGCSAQFTTNAGHAVSRGGDLQVQFRPIHALSVTVEASYTDAHYTGAVLGPTPVAGATQSVIVNQGDTLPVAPWNVDASARYDFAKIGNWGPYLRGDYQYASAYKRTTGPGTVAYAPEQYWADSTQFVSARLGATNGHLELSVFVDNLLNSIDTLSQITGGRGTCRNTACTSYAINEPQYIGQTFRPRTIGLQAALRY